jgi:ankyrin repeat protein
MNFVRKSVFVGVLIIVASGCAHSNHQQAREYPVQLCEKAKYGQLDIENTPITDPHTNAYLLDCAVSVVISQVSFQSGPHKGNKAIKESKEMIGQHFLLQTLDLTYRNEDGNNVLMSVITSFLPEPWKEKTVGILLEKGVDLKEKNHNDDTALDIAKFKGNERIVKLVAF